MTKEMKQEFTLKISQANKTQMIVILYEMTMAYLDEAVEANEKGDQGGFRTALRRARGCVNELVASLNFEYELADNLMSLYTYVYRELARADVKGQKEPIRNAEKVLRGLLDAYRELSKLNQDQPVMVNAQTVYTGLTYGRKQLLESLSNHGGNRGFSV